MNIRSWLQYLDLRTEAGTQLEHRQIAEQCRDIFALHFPTITEAVWPETTN